MIVSLSSFPGSNDDKSWWVTEIRLRPLDGYTNRVESEEEEVPAAEEVGEAEEEFGLAEAKAAFKKFIK